MVTQNLLFEFFSLFFRHLADIFLFGFLFFFLFVYYHELERLIILFFATFLFFLLLFFFFFYFFICARFMVRIFFEFSGNKSVPYVGSYYDLLHHQKILLFQRKGEEEKLTYSKIDTAISKRDALKVIMKRIHKYLHHCLVVVALLFLPHLPPPNLNLEPKSSLQELWSLYMVT